VLIPVSLSARATGIEMAVDLGSGAVWMFKDREIVPIPPPDIWSEYASLPKGVSERTDVKPLYITQPEGPSFSVNGWRVRTHSCPCSLFVACVQLSAFGLAGQLAAIPV
jgi:Cu2+-containing amine oxidase